MVYKSIMTQDDLAFDKQHIWHPYTSTTRPLPVYPVASAHGCELHLASGEQLVDGMSSWWAAIHGYNHPRLNAAMKAQIDQMSHVMFGGITHQPAVDLCRRLVAMTPESLECVFLADSGSVAVEVAMKMALQYWHARGETRQRFLTFRNGYHGDTFGAMSVCDPDNSMHSLWKGYLPENLQGHAAEKADVEQQHFGQQAAGKKEVQRPADHQQHAKKHHKPDDAPFEFKKHQASQQLKGQVDGLGHAAIVLHLRQARPQGGKPFFQHGADGIGRSPANVLAHPFNRGPFTV